MLWLSFEIKSKKCFGEYFDKGVKDKWQIQNKNRWVIHVQFIEQSASQ
jgi:predicted transposase YbfD/YdcC